MVSGTTQVVAVIGHPIAQVKSPDNFNRYFAEQHMDSVMIPVDIVPDAVAAYLNALRGWQVSLIDFDTNRLCSRHTLEKQDLI